jgi:hypothetical protein
MKKIITLISAFILAGSLMAQAPQSFNYQAVVRDAGGNIIASTQVSMRISILQGSISGTAVCEEVFIPVTNTFGLVTLAIGSMEPTDFSAIDWSAGPYFVKVELLVPGNVIYSDMGTSQILSVPYSLYAKSAGNGFSGNYSDLANKPTLFSGSYNDLTNQPVLFNGDYNNLTNKPAIFDGTWTNLAGKPSTLTGYGITDGMSTSHSANSITSTNITNWNTAYGWGNHGSAGYVINTRTLTINGTALDLSDNRSWSVGTVTSIATNNGITGGTITAAGTVGLTGQALALHNLGTNGIIVRTGAGTVVTRSLSGTNGINIINGNGISGNPSIGLTGQALALHNLNSAGLIARNSIGTIYARAIQAGSGIVVTNGNGSAGNPNISVKTYSVGDFAFGGIVFFIDDTGQHGLVCAKGDQSIAARWYAGTFGRTQAKGDGPFSGEMNTAIIIAAHVAIGDDNGTYAARICNEAEIVENGITYGNWYLPSQSELTLMYSNRTVINSTALANGGSAIYPSWYWSSNESSIPGEAYARNFNDGASGPYGKMNIFRVRAVRAF